MPEAWVIGYLSSSIKGTQWLQADGVLWFVTVTLTGYVPVTPGTGHQEKQERVLLTKPKDTKLHLSQGMVQRWLPIRDQASRWVLLSQVIFRLNAKQSQETALSYELKSPTEAALLYKAYIP